MAIETNEIIDVKTLPPFKKFIMTIGNIPTSYLESMTYAELVMWFCNYLQNTVIPTVNNNADALQELIDYIKNLDLQDEVDHKLDEMAEDGTLANVVGQYFTNGWKLLQPYLGGEMGACTIIKKDDFVIMFDCAYTGQDSALSTYLATNGITHIDVLMISHFHGDHAGCQQTILENFCDENTKIYIGMVPDYSEFGIDETASELRYEQFQTICETLGYTYTVPVNNSTENINGIDFRFLNTDPNYLTDYYSSYSDTNLSNYQLSGLNNCSMVCEITINGSKILLTSDIEQPAETKIKDYIQQVDLLQVPHHNWNSYGDKEFFDNANAKLAFANRGVSAVNYFPYFSRYSKFVKPTRIIQNLSEHIEITSVYNHIIVNSGVDFETAFDDDTKIQLLTYLPDASHCLFNEVDLYDFSVWDSDYIFGLYQDYSDRRGLMIPFYRNSRYTALVTELTKMDSDTSHAVYDLHLSYLLMDFTFSSFAFATYRIYKNATIEAQKYITLIPEGYSNKELTGSNINLDNVRYRQSFVAYVSDDDTTNVYVVPVYKVNSSLSNAQYIGYWQNLSSSRYLTLMKVEMNFSGSSYTLNYYRLVFDKTNGTWTANETNPVVTKIKI